MTCGLGESTETKLSDFVATKTSDGPNLSLPRAD